MQWHTQRLMWGKDCTYERDRKSYASTCSTHPRATLRLPFAYPRPPAQCGAAQQPS